MSFPFYGKQFTLTQPDGTTLAVKGWGDQHHAIFETMDGYPVMEDPITRFYQYAKNEDNNLRLVGLVPNKLDPSVIGLTKNSIKSFDSDKSKILSSNGLPQGNPRWKERRKEAKMELINSVVSSGIHPAPPQRDTVGDYVGLCLLIQFPDLQGTIKKEDVEAFCNEQGYSGYDNNGSVYDYYFDNSNGKLRYKNLIAPYYTAKYNKSYYANEAIKAPIKAIELIEEALHFHKTNGFDFSSLSSDNQNNVYALNVFYAGNNLNNWVNGLYPHSHNLNSAFNLDGDKAAYDYQISDMGRELTLATFCHENGHMICNFPDLYDYGRDSRGIGAYCLMCVGGNTDPKNPAQVCAYLKYKAGWSQQVTNLAPGLNETISSDKNQFFLFRKGATEYYIIENRNKSGRDTSLADSGLTVWHVDELGSNNNQQMSPTLHYECSLIQADGKNDLENGVNDGNPGDLFYSPNNNDIGPNSTPAIKWWDGTAVNLEISNIGQPGNLMTFSTL